MREEGGNSDEARDSEEGGTEGQERDRGKLARQNAHKFPPPPLHTLVPPTSICWRDHKAQHLTLTSLITGCRSARDLTQTDILSKSSKVIGSFGIPDLPRWMMLEISSITSAANICGQSGEGGAGVVRGG